MPTLRQQYFKKKGNAIRQQRFRDKKKAQARQSQERASREIVHGVQAEAEHLPAEYQTRFPAETSREVLLTTLEDMTSGAITMLEWLEDCSALEAAKSVGHFQQLVNRLVKLRGQDEGGKLKAAKFGTLTDERAEKFKRELAQALGFGLTKFKFTYTYLREHGLENEDGSYRRHAVEGLGSILAGSATTIETWLAIRQWEDDKNAKPSNSYVDALRRAPRA